MMQQQSGLPEKPVDELFGEMDDLNDFTLAELLRRPRFSDCVLKCKGTTWRCHRAILASRCDFFSKAFSGSFVVRETKDSVTIAALIGSISKESQSQVVDLDDDDPEALEILLVYLYTKPDYIESRVPELRCVEKVQFLSNLIIIADKYGVCDLISLVRHTLECVILLHKAKHGTETLELLVLLAKVVFGPEACPRSGSGSLKDAIALLACQEFKIVPDQRKNILQLMEEYVELRERMTRMSLLTDKLKNIKAVP